jgi:ribonuclease-3
VRKKGPTTIEEFALHLDLEPDQLPLIRRALTHRSQADVAPLGDNERLEFFGDSILAMLVCEHLYLRFPEHSEGELTKMKANLVSEPSLAAAARELNLGQILDMSRGEARERGRDRPSTLADAFEAVVAALYLIGGLDRARTFLREYLFSRVDLSRSWDYKSALQEFTQVTLKLAPRYIILQERGPAHEKEFVAEVRLGEELLGTGRGGSKKQAQQLAAAEALARLRSRYTEAEEKGVGRG